MNVNVRHLLMMLFKASGGKVNSKTKIQKEIYLISIKLGIDLKFKPHYYGPYSPEVEQGLDELIGAGFIGMTRKFFGIDIDRGFEFKRYDFEFTESGKKLSELLKEDKLDEYQEIEGFIKELNKMGDPDYLTLSIAAKAYFILDKEDKPMNSNAIKERAILFGWNITDEDIDKAIDILSNFNFVKQK